jgi:hypothetical protein
MADTRLATTGDAFTVSSVPAADPGSNMTASVEWQRVDFTKLIDAAALRERCHNRQASQSENGGGHARIATMRWVVHEQSQSIAVSR